MDHQINSSIENQEGVEKDLCILEKILSFKAMILVNSRKSLGEFSNPFQK